MQVPAELKSLPNQLTIARIVAVPVICALLIAGVEWALWLRWIALTLYVLAAITDWLDGFLARRMGQSSDLGKMLDPIADKLLVGALLLTLAWTRPDGLHADISFWELPAAIAILLREIFVSGLREFMSARAVEVPVTFLAKWKTTVQLVALFFVIVDSLLADPSTGFTFGFISGTLLWVAALLTVWTGWQYLVSVWPYFGTKTE